MDPYRYGGYSNVPNNQYQNTQPYIGAVPAANPYQVYPPHVAVPAAQYGDPRQWSQPPHPTHYQIPGMPVSAGSANPGGSQWPPMWTEVDGDSSRGEKIRRGRTACEECRKRKQRCDGTEPCQQCIAQRTACRYSAPNRSKKQTDLDRAIELAEDNQSRITSLSNEVARMTAQMGGMDRHLRAEQERAGVQTAGQNSSYPRNAQYGSAQDYAQYNTRLDGGDERPGNASETSRSKRRRH